jgi:hypothetical protein
MTEPNFTSLAEAAARYAAWGWPVLPIHTPDPGGCSCGHLDCRNHGKHPRLRRGLHQASADRAQVATWWERWPNANVAIATGRLVVVDVDGDRGAHTLEELQARHEPLSATTWVSTARGRHLYFDAGDVAIRNSAGRLGPGLDVRGRGGYAIAPPSRHAIGHTYAWHALTVGIAPLPAWLAAITVPVRRPRSSITLSTDLLDRYVAAALAGELDRIACAAPHTRNDMVNRAAFRLGQLAGAGLVSADALEGPLLDAARAVGQGEREARATIASGLGAGQANPRSIAERRARTV